MDPSIRDLIPIALCFILAIVCACCDMFLLGCIGGAIAGVLFGKWEDKYTSEDDHLF